MVNKAIVVNAIRETEKSNKKKTQLKLPPKISKQPETISIEISKLKLANNASSAT